MLHPREPIFVPLNFEAERASYEVLQQAIAKSQTSPYRQLALGLGIVALLVRAACAAGLQLLNRRPPDLIAGRLSEFYYAVPAMALHKKIELDELARAEITGRTLDVGCGSGIIGALVKDLSKISELHGLDMLPSFDAQVREHGYAGFTASDAASMKLPEASFDSVFSVCVLEHVHGLDDALRGIARVLRPGGRLYFTTPAPEFRQAVLEHRLWRALGMTRRAEAASRQRDASAMQYHYCSQDDWKSALEKLGFEQIEVRPFFSRTQLLVYDLLNFEVSVPKFYHADKMQSFLYGNPRWHKLALWSTAVLATKISRLPCRPGHHTHWAVIATRRG